MKLLFNPVVVRMVLVTLAAMAAFAIGAFVIHRFRKDLSEEAESLSQSPLAADGLPIHSYHAVIQQLKQQKHELAAQQLSERRKARASEAVSAVVYANLPCGVLFFNTSGLLRQANPAARHLLGFASPIGMGVADLFRAAHLRRNGSSQTRHLLDAMAPALSGESVVRNVPFDFVAPDGSSRALEMTISPVLGEDARLMGTSVLLTETDEEASIHQEEEARRELAAEMALGLRSSLATISGYAQQMAKTRDPELARQLAADISSEAAQLDRTLGGFLKGAKNAAAGS